MGSWWTVGMVAAVLAAPATAAPDRATPDLAAMLAYPFVDELAASGDGSRIAWLTTVAGKRNVWTAPATGAARAVTTATADDGQELTNLAVAPDGGRLAWVRGGAHDANWPAEGGLQPNPADAADQPKLTVWTARTAAGPAVAVGEGDRPALATGGRLAFVRDGAVWLARLDASAKGAAAKPAKAFFDRGKDRDLTWSPAGDKLAFVSHRGDHSFIGVFTVATRTVTWLAPSSGNDENPVWSPDGTRVAYTHRLGDGGAPEPLLVETPHPWSIRVADVATGTAREVWASGRAIDASFPEVPGGPMLRWLAGDTLAFRAEMDGWAHLYALPVAGGAPRLLTPGRFIVESVGVTTDRTALLYTANTGPDAADDDRRHIFRVGLDGSPPVLLTPGTGVEFQPAAVAGGIAYIAAGTSAPHTIHISRPDGDRALTASAFPAAGAFVVPRKVTFTAADGTTIHGQVFEAAGGAAKKPAVIFVHGGPPRQMLLGWSYMDYYSNAYATNQALALRGFVVLSVNYRLGIGYGRAFQHPDKGGPAGASEYQDVVAAAKWLQAQPEVDGARLGIWGGSYGGYLTGLALARNSDLFKAGVDLHGVHDWSRVIAEEAYPAHRYEQGDWAEFMKVSFAASPSADVATWKSPVLLIHGDDDRNVRFNQTVDLARRLDAAGVTFEELVIPNEIHGFLRHATWLEADAATIDFLTKTLKP